MADAAKSRNKKTPVAKPKPKAATPTPKAKPTPKPKAKPDVVPAAEDLVKRTFTVHESSIGKTGGRYYALTPMQAGTKAGRQLFHCIEKQAKFQRFRGTSVITFTMRETTRGRPRDSVYKYEVTRTEKANQRAVEFSTIGKDGKKTVNTVNYKWNYSVRKMSDE